MATPTDPTLEGDYRVEWRGDGYYVVGHGEKWAVDSVNEGLSLISAELNREC